MKAARTSALFRILRFVLITLALFLQEAGAQPVAPPVIVSRQDWGAEPVELSDHLLHFPTYLTIHHAGVAWKKGDDPIKKLRGLQAWGRREKGWPDLPYHYLIAPDGRIFEGRDWHYRPESNTDYDLDGTLNVHLWGNFDEQVLPCAQLQSLIRLCAWLSFEHSLSTAQIRTHRQAAPGQTTCPGDDVQRYLEDGSLIRWVNSILTHSSNAPAIEVKPPNPKLKAIEL